MANAKLLKNAFQSVVSRSYPVSTIIFLQGEKAKGVHLIRRGQVRLVIYSANGQIVFERTHGPGDILGLPAVFANAQYSMTAETITEASVAFIPKESLLFAMSEDAKLGFACLRMLSDEVRVARSAIPSTKMSRAQNA